MERNIAMAAITEQYFHTVNINIVTCQELFKYS